MRADRQTNRQAYRHANRNILRPTGVELNVSPYVVQYSAIMLINKLTLVDVAFVQSSCELHLPRVQQMMSE